jgi:hypothetical protein
LPLLLIEHTQTMLRSGSLRGRGLLLGQQLHCSHRASAP